jgi:hypothetical protein
MRDLITRYDWIQRLDVVLTLGITTKHTMDEVVSIYGGDPTRASLMTTLEAEDAALDDEGHFYVQVFDYDTSVIALENNGWSGVVPEIARRAAADGGHFLSVHWNVNGLFRITEAYDGKVTAYFEPGAGSPAPDDMIPEWMFGIEFAPGQIRATCLALVEAQTGVAFDRQWLETKLPTYRIPDPDALLKDVEGARTP